MRNASSRSTNSRDPEGRPRSMRMRGPTRPGCGEDSSNTCARGGTGLLACPSAGYKYVMSYYERNLPHWQPEGAALFLTWRLHGSLPRFARVTPKNRGDLGARLAWQSLRRQWTGAWMERPPVPDGSILN